MEVENLPGLQSFSYFTITQFIQFFECCRLWRTLWNCVLYIWSNISIIIINDNFIPEIFIKNKMLSSMNAQVEYPWEEMVFWFISHMFVQYFGYKNLHRKLDFVMMMVAVVWFCSYWIVLTTRKPVLSLNVMMPRANVGWTIITSALRKYKSKISSTRYICSGK